MSLSYILIDQIWTWKMLLKLIVSDNFLCWDILKQVYLCADQKETSTFPTPTGKPRAFDDFLCPGSREFVRGVENLTFVWVGQGKLNRKCQLSNEAPKSLTATNTCLDEVEKLKERDVVISYEAAFSPVINWTVKGILAV